jgi:deoxyribodipyrimidine photo-lyase
MQAFYSRGTLRRVNKTIDRALVWLRRDLRADDHAALYHALRAARQVWCAFVFDRAILDPLPRADRRVEFLRDSLEGVDAALHALGTSHGTAGTGLIVRHGLAIDEIPWLAAELGVQAVYANHDDEPDALARDARVLGRLADLGVVFHTSKDHVVFERSEVLTQAGAPFSVFTPYKNAWLRRADDFFLAAWPVARHASALAPVPAGQRGVPALEDHRLRAHQPAHAAPAQRPGGRRRNCWTTSWSASTATTRRATFPPSRAPAT